jgi:hypothetical protein
VKQTRRDNEDKRFQDKLLAMLEWLAENDPVRAAKLVGEYMEDLVREAAGDPIDCPDCP